MTEAEAVTASKRPPSREGKRALTVYLPPEAWKQLRMLAVNLETSTQGTFAALVGMQVENVDAGIAGKLVVAVTLAA